MSVLIVGAEKTFPDLRSRIFTGRVSRQVSAEVSDAIQKANPHVNLDALEPGTILTVPDLPGVDVRGDLSIDDTSKQAVAGLVDELGATLADLAAAAKARDQEAAAERAQLETALSATELAAIAGKDKAFAATLKAARDAVANADAETKARAAALDAAHADWDAELKAMGSLVHRAG
jgi:hypothetical protein